MLRVTGLAAGFGDGPDVVADVDLDVGPGEVVALLGPSGSGKTTLLRCVAGLHRPRRGLVAIGGEDVADVPIERRGIGLVFQDHALLPHRDVAGNVGLGPRLQGLPGPEVAARVAAALADVGLAALADRPVDALSGGEQQRVALARSLAARPRLLLLDEPYGALDRPLRARLLAELPPLVHASGAGALLVTHDQDDALAVADRVAVLIGGRLRQLATPEECWTRPADAEVAAFLGVGPLLTVAVRAGRATSAAGTVAAPEVGDGPARLLLPAARVRLAGEADAADDVTLTARLDGLRFAGDHHLVALTVAGLPLRLRRHRPPADAPGAEVTLRVAPGDVRWFPA